MILIVPEIWLPVCVKVAERKVLKPSMESVLASHFPARSRTVAVTLVAVNVPESPFVQPPVKALRKVSSWSLALSTQNLG